MNSNDVSGQGAASYKLKFDISINGKVKHDLFLANPNFCFFYLTF